LARDRFRVMAPGAVEWASF